MKTVIFKILSFFLSLRTAIWLLLALVFLLLYGAFVMPAKPEFATINSLPLFDWLRDNATSVTWWLYAVILVLSVLTANTIICSIESLIKKQQHKRWLLIISPQIIHIGFLFILIAHLLDSTGSFKGGAVAYEGSLLRLPDNTILEIKDIRINISQSGYVSDWEARINYHVDGRKIKEDSLKPNLPSFYKGFGVYLKNVQAYPFKSILIEVSKEPGAVWALIGGILFMLGTITLLILKIKKET